MRASVVVVVSSVALAAAAPPKAQERPSEIPPRAELALSDETLQLSYITGAEIADRLPSQMVYGLFLSEERDLVGSAALLVNTDLRLMPRLEIQVAPKAYAALLSEESNDVLAIAFGIQGRLEVDRQRDLAIVGYAFYAPDVVTFGSADNLTDFMARAEIGLTARLIGFAGYRWFEFDQLIGGTRNLQNELFVGVQWQLD